MSEVLIRPAAAGDVPSITGIYADAVEHGTATFEIEPPGEAEMARRREVLSARNYPYLAAELGGAVVGYAYAGPYRDRPAYDWCVEDSIYIAREFQRRGIGQLLLRRLIAEAETRGFRQMVAVIGDSARQAGSIALHARAGFDPIGRLRSVGYKHGRWLDSVLMQRALGRGDAAPP
jgi:L-amino acid N-acyltransferase YncA